MSISHLSIAIYLQYIQCRISTSTSRAVYPVYSIQNSLEYTFGMFRWCILSRAVYLQYSYAELFVVYVLNHNCSIYTGCCKTSVKILYQMYCTPIYMSQMLYAGQSGREIVTFLSDFQQLCRAQFMYYVHEILIHGSQPILHPCIKISWTLANFMA